MEIVKLRKQTLIGSLRVLPISDDECLKVDISKRKSALRTMARLKPYFRYTTKTIGSDFYIWRIA